MLQLAVEDTKWHFRQRTQCLTLIAVTEAQKMNGTVIRNPMFVSDH